MIPNISLLNKFAKGALPCAVGYYGKDCVIYSRVSTKEQSENNHSLEWQKSTCEKFAKDNGMNIIEYFGGTYESAKTDERKEFNRMLKFVQKNKNVAYIIVFSLDRFSRTGDNAIYISSQLKKNGVHIVSATQRIDTSTSAGVLHQNIEFVLCNNENNVRRDRSVTGMHEKLKRGEWIGPAPIGYSYDHNAKEQTIYINDKGEHIKQAFIMRSEGVSYPEISKYLINHGIACYKQMLSKLFRNPFYCGYMSHNLLFGEVTKGNHEALISQELFLRVNGKLKKDGFKQKKANVELPLKGFVFDYKTNEKFMGYLVKKKGIYYYKVNKAGVKVNRSQKIM
ncbi:MAG: recombinase family protein, partial [Bacteroidia bacterium]